MIKIGAIVAVNCDEDNIEYCLKGIYDFCDKVVVVYSNTNWMNEKKEDRTIEIIDKFPDPLNKLKIIKGSFVTQPGQRTVGLEYLREENYDYVFVVDSDEIYKPENLLNAKSFIEQNKNIQQFRVNWCQMWKTLDYIITPKGKLFVIYKIDDKFCFTGPSRNTSTPKKTKFEFLPNVDCFHLTCVCSNEYMKEKLGTRTYRNSIVKNWYENIWLKWTFEMRNLHPTSPKVYEKAILFDKTILPDFMKNHKFYGFKK